MSDELDQWQWVDEDPFEKLLRKPAPVVPSAPESASECFDQALGLETKEQWEQAANLFHRSLELDPERSEARIRLGACLLHLNRAEEALASFERALSSEPERALFGKAVALQKLSRHKDSELAYRELLRMAPNYIEALGNLIALSVERQDVASLAEFSNRLLQLEPQSKIALQGLATHAIWNRDGAAAVKYCSALVEIDPTSFEARSNLAFARRKLRPATRAMRSSA